ncbi:uncharacterized protein LOC136029497 [Artemia franciscana]
MNEGFQIVKENMGLQAAPNKRPLEEIEVFTNAKIQCTMKDRLYNCLESASEKWSGRYAKRTESCSQNTFSSYGQNIKCEENGKMYVQLGTMVPVQDSTSYGFAAKRFDSMTYQQRQHYRKQRLSVFNISMFKLKKYRQFSDPCLHRSVLVCNTLRRIENEMEREGLQCLDFQCQQSASFDPVPAQNFYVPPPSPLLGNQNDNEEGDSGISDETSSISWRTVLNMSNGSCLDSVSDIYSSELNASQDVNYSSESSSDESSVDGFSDLQMEWDDFTPNWQSPSNLYSKTY